ncbi:SCO4225 family membrane protein [Streptomyces sp. NPDC088116]|uniref:SCO4225 family membrane protein n=1 Tax=Streptomyces sp. NPDC088116 TaxID=3365825 RepID=UPI00382F08F8
MPKTSNSPLHIVRSSLTNVVALAYLVVCAGLLIWALTASAGDDASFAGVIPLLATAPVSLVLLVLPEGLAMVILSVVLGALVNALVIGWCVRTLRQGRQGRGSA